MKTKPHNIEEAQSIRTNMLALIQRMKDHGRSLHVAPSGAHEAPAADTEELQRQHDLSLAALEEAALRQNLCLRALDPEEEPASPLPVPLAPHHKPQPTEGQDNSGF